MKPRFKRTSWPCEHGCTEVTGVMAPPGERFCSEACAECECGGAPCSDECVETQRENDEASR